MPFLVNSILISNFLQVLVIDAEIVWGAAVNISNLSTSSQKKEPNESYKLVMKIIHEGLKYIKRDPRTSSHVISAIKVLEDEANEEEEDKEEEALEEEDEDEEGHQQTMMGN